MPEPQAVQPKGNEALLQEIREHFIYACDAWRDIRDEAKEDMRYVAGEHWPDGEKSARQKMKRPCLSFDELGQYTNQLINDLRMNKRAPKVSPKEGGADEKTAEFRQGKIRDIENYSNAQAAYITAFESAVQRSYGYFGIKTKYVNDESLEQEICVRRIPNADTVYPDPDGKEVDGSDWGWCFVIDVMPVAKYKASYPNREIKDFSAEQLAEYPQWLKDKTVQVAEYWKVHVTYSDLVVGDQKRKVEKRRVVQYITNGVEILETNEWAGRWIPIVPVYGKEIYVDEGGGSKRKLLSLVRLARAPQQLYSYYRTCAAEIVGMTPKSKWGVFEGQIEGHEQEWQNANIDPTPVLVAKPVPDGAGGILPFPQRIDFEPPIQALEIGAESARRAIQAAMGISPLPTAAQRRNEKSGIALERIEAQQQRGSSHFIDNYDRALEHAGRIMNDLIPKIYDTPRETAIMLPDETRKRVRLVPGATTMQDGQYDATKGEHEVTIAVGPSFESQREEAQAFLDTLAGTDLFPRVADLVVKARQLGALGDEMAARLTPPEFAAKDGQEPLPPQAVAILQQVQQQLQAVNEYAKALEAELKKLQSEKDGKIVDNQFRMEIEKLKLEAQITIAEINAKVQDTKMRLEREADMWKHMHGEASETARQITGQAHEREMAEAAASREKEMAAAAQEAQPVSQ